jgi:uncharacterized protein (DUF1499 family)
MKIKILVGAIILLILIISIITIRLYKGNSSMPKNLGVENGELAPVPKTPNAVSTQTDDQSKKVDPFKFQGDKEESRGKIKKAIRTYGGASIITEEENYLHVIFTTPLLNFKDDVEFYFDEDNEVIHFRSASRVGRSDLGLNKERYDELIKLYYDNG